MSEGTDPARLEAWRKPLTASFVVLMGLRTLGAAISPALLAHAPLVLVLMSPFVSHLVIVAALVDPVAFFAAAVSISILQCFVGYGFGLSCGPVAQAWVEARSPGAARRVAQILGWLQRAAPVVLMLVPGPIVATLAGVARVTFWRFTIPMLVAQVIWIALCHALGAALTDWMQAVQSFALDHALWLTIAFVAVAVGRRAWRALRAREQTETNL